MDRHLRGLVAEASTAARAGDNLYAAKRLLEAVFLSGAGTGRAVLALAEILDIPAAEVAPVKRRRSTK